MGATRILLGLALCAWCALGQGEALLQCRGSAAHWRDIAYLKPPMSRYSELRNCIAWTAYQFDLPEELIYSILYVERGPVNGKCSSNRNGTRDCGPAQINDVRMRELSRFDLSREDIKSRPCHNIWAMGYLIRREIEKAGGVVWRGVGNYHFHYSVNPSIHGRYVTKVRSAWEQLERDIREYCAKDASGG
ncbi:MAG: lytic transglycosylase domain-containing protein [Succinivibrionaceae bacterium]|nr:lytic transglycosylase domain-containing protein [Succinivibrionaceae bacterium]